MNNPIDKAWIVFAVFAVDFRIGKRILVILVALSQYSDSAALNVD